MMPVHQFPYRVLSTVGTAEAGQSSGVVKAWDTPLKHYGYGAKLKGRIKVAASPVWQRPPSDTPFIGGTSRAEVGPLRRVQDAKQTQTNMPQQQDGQ